MKSIFKITFLFAAGLLVFSCNSSSTSTASADVSAEQVAKDWEDAKEAFHTVMAGTFHPAEEGDLAPLKEKYDQLADVSSKWAKLPMPANEEGKGLDKLLNKLSDESTAIGKVVQGGNDEDMKNAIFALHDVFHEIVGLCDH
jgi:hypothetical protein